MSGRLNNLAKMGHKLGQAGKKTWGKKKKKEKKGKI